MTGVAPVGAALLAVFLGAGVGVCLRYGLGETLNLLVPKLPLGTLAANLIGGISSAWRSPSLPGAPICRCFGAWR